MEQKLTLSIKIRYGLADLGFSLITSAMQFFLLFYYTDVAGINSALAGTALMVGKLTWDAVNDPLFGYFSDRTRSRFGRRRIYMLIGAVPLGIAAWLSPVFLMRFSRTRHLKVGLRLTLIWKAGAGLIGRNYI